MTCEHLKEQVKHIANTLENPPEVDEDGTPTEDLGWIWDDESECYRDEDGDEVPDNAWRDMSGFDYLTDGVLDVEFRVGSDREYRSAEILVALGGPNIWIDTKSTMVKGAWWGDYFEYPYTDNIGLDEACEEWFNC